MELTIEKLASDAIAMAHFNGKTVFVPGLLPGERAECEAKEEKSGYITGQVICVDGGM